MMATPSPGLIVWAPQPGMLKWIASRPGCALASRIALRSEPGPASAVFVDQEHRWRREWKEQLGARENRASAASGD